MHFNKMRQAVYVKGGGISRYTRLILFQNAKRKIKPLHLVSQLKFL